MRRMVIAALISCTYGYGSVIGAELQDITVPPRPGKHIHLKTHCLHIHCLGKAQPSVMIETRLGGSALEWLSVQRTLAQRVQICREIGSD